MQHETSRPVTALAAGIGAALLMSATPTASANPFGFQSAAGPFYQYGQPQATQRTAFRSRGGENRKEEAKDHGAGDEILAKGKGPWSVFVSIDKQHLTLYSGDKPVAHTKVSTGTASHPTPTGVFSIIQRNRWHRSNLYGNAPMWFMQRITWSGVAMHQGHVTGQPASHGCIRLPEAFARQLWGITKMGNRVIVTKGEIAPAAFSNPKLFVFKRAPEPKQPEPAEPAVSTLPSADDTVKSAYNTLETTALRGASRPALRLTATDAGGSSDPGLVAVTKPLKPGPIAVFISRKEGKIFVRKGFEPVFDAPVTFEQPDQPLGTHVYTALNLNADSSSFRWMAVTVPTTNAAEKGQKTTRIVRGKKVTETASTPAVQVNTNSADALNRVNIPQDALDRIQDLMTPGASLIISDKGLGRETGKGTDFIVLTP
jgi:hypothetical protein